MSRRSSTSPSLVRAAARCPGRAGSRPPCGVHGVAAARCPARRHRSPRRQPSIGEGTPVIIDLAPVVDGIPDRRRLLLRPRGQPDVRRPRPGPAAHPHLPARGHPSRRDDALAVSRARLPLGPARAGAAATNTTPTARSGISSSRSSGIPTDHLRCPVSARRLPRACSPPALPPSTKRLLPGLERHLVQRLPGRARPVGGGAAHRPRGGRGEIRGAARRDRGRRLLARRPPASRPTLGCGGLQHRAAAEGMTPTRTRTRAAAQQRRAATEQAILDATEALLETEILPCPDRRGRDGGGRPQPHGLLPLLPRPRERRPPAHGPHRRRPRTPPRPTGWRRTTPMRSWTTRAAASRRFTATTAG